MFVEFVVKKKQQQQKKKKQKKTLQAYIKVQLKFSSVLQASCAHCHVKEYCL